MSLSELPDEILGLISFWLNGFDLCSLWMASDPRLRQRLVNNVITEFDITYMTPGRYLWPGNFLKKLKRLSRLSLLANGQAQYHLPIHDAELFSIPTLKYLRLHCTNAFEMLQQKSSISPNSSTGSPRNPSVKIFMNLNDIFSSLDYFEIQGDCEDSDLSIDFLRCLPQNLKSLSIPQNYLILSEEDLFDQHIQPNYIGLLPQTLTTLNLSFLTDSDEAAFLDLSTLPPNLSSLCTNTLIDEELYPMVPQNIKELKLIASANNIDIRKLSPFLPSGLRSLKLSLDNSISLFESLSHLKNLEDLDIRILMQEISLLTKCPPTLKRFSGTSFELKDLQVSPFADGITTVSLSAVKGITSDFFALLPQTVTFLSMTAFPIPQSFQFFKLLPKRLVSLDLNLNIIEKTSLLPKSLTYLRLTTEKSIEESHFDQLPPMLESLNLNTNIPKSMLIQLPSTLKVLELTSDSVIVDDQVISMLPRDLKRLTFQTKCNVTDASAGRYPPNLEYLVLESNIMLTDDAIVQLPRSLTYLAFPKNPNFTDNCVKYLPRKLVHLYLRKTVAITGSSAKDLPRYLCSLCLDSCSAWSPDSVHNLPEFLNQFEVGSFFTKRAWFVIRNSE